ncbi:UDP-N-acetylglucosamine 2-epimerase (non-hydrolyzing) [Pseudenhygromyxa sp. WMMC2535]|uniref:non-hydrolyzing UDP-N-acetylglucosamine 2-epimerase n=1 Tax=Pseudenhygromyxa sp. WMMC2535 TaxID=2712867 RepID=UPI0015523C2F|nr:UDP-N-acetylglucosamine 2-epimerase (non-hydrolyzing) [Pseudenhygromyxa sp. WMMC2535]NVB40370.1 UDP-N-acetylglucosamine 2-epimerase (non-hydrolyzing) [Pseudenhygromyxa sp. WMMC2535]
MPTSPRKVLCVLGTRPEAIKLAPLVRELAARRSSFQVRLCATGQHRELLDDALRAFGLVPDCDLDLMRPGQDPAALLARTITALGPVIADFRPDVVVVQGDTTSTLAGALAAYYARVPVAHVEAGLRSGDPFAPFPEEQHRRMVDQLARWLFAPTESARQNLLREGHPPERVQVTGNTGVDALRWLEREAQAPAARRALDERLAAHGVSIDALGSANAGQPPRRLVVATVHRREQIDGPLEDICAALREVAALGGVELLMPIHPNPDIRAAVDAALVGSAVRRIPALDPLDFVGLLRRAALVITDSGGVQEEAATLGVPALIVRPRSDRPESVAAGDSRVVGHDPELILAAAARILDAEPRMGTGEGREIFGDGRAAVRIADALAL